MVSAPSWEVAMDPNHGFDVTTARSERLVALRTAIAAGSYAPDPESIAESLVGWIATPEQFERSVKKSLDDADREGHTAQDHHPRR
jgi:hypothetical protein